jgi:hypothetical protein
LEAFGCGLSDSATSSERRILEGYLWELSFKQIRTAEIS